MYTRSFIPLITWVAAATLLLPACFDEKKRVEFVVVDQDINESESEVADKAIGILLQQDNIQMVICYRKGLYEVHGKQGKVFFRRVQGTRAYSYEVVTLEGENPIANQDPSALPDRESELAAGDNPLALDYTKFDPGYSGAADPRVSFLSPEKSSYPLAYERIAAFFDGEHAGDLMIEFTPWGWYPLGDHGDAQVGAHGQLGLISSRGPLIFAGKGAHKGKVIDGWARSVDIAPTVAKAMGIEKTWGVDESGRYSRDNYLKWQDGHVLEEVLDGETPTHVVILTNDALTMSELDHQLKSDRPLPTYRWLAENGTRYRYGSIVNFPSNTYPSHNAIGTGAYSGHHGLIDNWFWMRKERKRENPVTEVFDTAQFIRDEEVETLHHAVHRSFDNWDGETERLGNFTLSANDPLVKSADHALLEGITPVDWSRCPEPKMNLPASDNDLSPRAQAADNMAVGTFVKTFVGTREQEGKQVRCSQPPRFVDINLALTDDISHLRGPHSPSMDRVFQQTDQRQQILFDTLKQAGIFDTTLFVFTSDHGQMLQDEQRAKDFLPALRDAGIRFRITYAMIYLLTFDVQLSSQTLAAGKETELEVTVKDDDTKEPVAEAVVTLESGGATATGTTDAGGVATIRFTPAADQTKVTVRDAESVPEDQKRTDFVKTY